MAQKMTIILLLFSVLCFFVKVNSQVLCEVGFCSDFVFEPGCATPAQHCNINNATHTGLSLLSPTLCNCCEFCLPLFLEGQPCSLGGPGDGITVGRCGGGLTCVQESDGNYCRRMTAAQSACHGEQDYYDERHQQGTTGALEHRPNCDGKGKYAPAACVPTQTCFCQDEDGHRIFGEVLYRGSMTIQSMQCGCSRMNEKIRSLVDPRLRQPVLGPRCTSDGNFNPVQCLNRICYCVDRITGAILPDRSINLDNTPVTDLSCYDASLDLFGDLTPFNYTSPCYEEQREKLDLLQQSEKDGFNVDFFSEIPDCLPDGTYGRVAITRNRTRICVDERGQQIADYEAEPYTLEYDKMNCKCAVTSQLMAGETERPVCCQNGNFRSIQCRRGQCRCVDEDGRQVGMESSNVIDLHCHSENWLSCLGY